MLGKTTILRDLIRQISSGIKDIKFKAVDEIGNLSDIQAINYAVCSGVKGIFTAHGSSLLDITINPILKELLSLNVIERIIFLDETKKGFIKEVYYLDKKNKEYILKQDEELLY